jgi:hypothetical protein
MENTVNKTTVSYKAMQSCKKLDSFFEEEEEIIEE